jgi:hypothetical protein
MNANNNQGWISDLTSNRPLADVITGAPAATPSTVAVTAQGTFAMPNLHVGRGYRYGNLDWYPIWSDAEASPRGYITEAASEDIRISELAQPNVGWLDISNTGAKDLIILEGTFIEAGFQHRALIGTVVVAAGSTQQIPVVCIERGRWGGAHGQQLGSRRAPAKVRGAIRGLRNSNRGATQGFVDQGEVWTRVAEYGRDLNRHNQTESLVEMRNGLDAEAKLPMVRALVGQVGVLIAIGGHPIAMEVFDHPKTLAERLDSIVASYLPDSATVAYQATPGYRVRSFVQKAGAKKLQVIEQSATAVNRPDVLIATQATVHKDRLVHISTLNAKHELVLAA